MMDSLLRLLDRIGPRVMVAAALGVAVVAALLVVRLAGDEGSRTPTFTDPGESTQEVHPEATSDDGESPEPAPSYGDNEVVLNLALEFTTAWLRRDLAAEAWLASLSPLCTPLLRENLAGVDPKSVPATAMSGQPVMVLRADTLAQVSIKVDTGVLRLRLLREAGNWRVDGVDWDRA